MGVSPKSNGLRASGSAEWRALLNRIVWSRQFEKSARLREFLVYVCERTEQGNAAELHEQEIGHRVFGRSEFYDTSQDNIVRVTASQARRKLEQYFASDGASEPVVLEIPKGKYAPIFRERDGAGGETSGPAGAEPRLWPKLRRYAVLTLAASAPVLAMIALWCAARVWSARAPNPEIFADPDLNALWSQLLPGGGRTDIVVCDSSLSLYQELLNRQLTLEEYRKPQVWAQANELSSNPALRGFAQQAAQRRYTSLANVTFVYRLAQLMGGNPNRTFISSARDLNIRQMKYDNVILLGSSRANPWVELLDGQLNFHFGFDNQTRRSYFENRAPHPGEPKTYRSDSSVSYCQIAFLPNLGRTGNVLAISGTEVEGTEGGGEFVTNARSMAQLRQYVRPDRDGRFPYFEILLKSSRVSGATTGVNIIAFRSPRM